MNKKSFNETLIKIGYPLTETQQGQFEAYRSFLQQENEKINLTALTSDEAIYEKHFVDCCLILDFLKDATSFGDVGSGAGFPGMVVAIMRPDISVTLIEPTMKRCRFLEDLSRLLKLDNVVVKNVRAEDFKAGFESFDVVSARAVAQLSILCEICLPLLKVGGKMIAMKSAQGQLEVNDASHALKTLQSEVVSIDQHILSDGSIRTNIEITKRNKISSKYPRSYAQIKKKPL